MIFDCNYFFDKKDAFVTWNSINANEENIFTALYSFFQLR